MKKHEIKKLVEKMTLKEKIHLLSGKDAWSTVPLERLGVPSVNLSDGPYGLRKCAGLGWGESYPATCFPSAALLACGWDEELAHRQGEAMGEEAQDQDVQVILGPGNNIKRSPLCGRNFEYFSEDPYLSGHMAAGVIRGIQSKGVAATLKHFAANNQESDRMVVDESISPEALREIYLASFEYPVKSAKPAAMMCAYNSINGQWCSQSYWLLTQVLRQEWGYKGMVMSDWGAVDNRPQGVYAGLDLEMPSSFDFSSREIMRAVKGEKVRFPSKDPNFHNKLKEKQVDKCAARVVNLAMDVSKTRTGERCDYDAHHELAADIAAECMVLLKNDGVLPLREGTKIAVLGEMAIDMRYQGSGSARVHSYKLSTPLEEIGKYADTVYSRGYSLSDDNDVSLVPEAAGTAMAADAAVIICGLPDSYESEGYDRKHLDLPPSHLELIYQVSRVQKNLVVVLCNGAPVTMPFLNDAGAVLEAYLGGQAAGKAIARLLFGKANPCGKLAETFPLALNHNPSYGNFPGDNRRVTYGENLLVGYRWYSTRQLPVLFPFGYGLSYTKFEYENIEVSSDSINEDDELTVKVTVRNTGEFDGKEIVQLYVRQQERPTYRPERELKGFAKLSIKAGESAEAVFTLDKRSFAHWSAEQEDWKVDSGDYVIMVGNSSAECPLSKAVHVTGRESFSKPDIYSEFRVLRTYPNEKARKLAEDICRGLGLDLEAGEKDAEKLAMVDYSILRSIVMMMGCGITMEELLERLKEID